MGLFVTIGDDLKVAMKSGDTKKRDTLRFLQSAIKNAAIDAHEEPSALSDAAVQAVVKRLVKQRKDSIEQYRAGNRQDLVDQETTELGILSAYLPVALSSEAIEKLVDEVLGKLGPVTQKDMGRIMGAVMQASKGKADGAVVRDIVSRRLQ